jgi:multiple sugar transport system permease protein
MVHWGATVGTARLMVIIADIWICTPFSMLVLLAGMQSIPKDLFEVAAIDGASPIQLFRYITLPLLKYPIMVVAVIRSMDALRVFDMIYSLTGGISGPNDTSITIMFNIYRYAFNYFQVGRASALSVLLIVMLFIISVFMMRLLRREAYS